MKTTAYERMTKFISDLGDGQRFGMTAAMKATEVDESFTKSMIRTLIDEKVLVATFSYDCPNCGTAIAILPNAKNFRDVESEMFKVIGDELIIDGCECHEAQHILPMDIDAFHYNSSFKRNDEI